MELSFYGRWLMAIGGLMVLVGGGLYLAGRFGLPLGRLPGDFKIEFENFSFYFPLTTTLLLSIGLSVLINLLGRLLRR
jgi:hypothetical protein